MERPIDPAVWQGLEHIGLDVTDLDRSLAWYGQVLGFAEVGRAPYRQGGADLLLGFARRAGLTLELIEDRQRRTPLAESGSTHLALRTADLDATLAALAARGVAPTFGPVENPALPARFAFIADPDGHRIEFYQPL